MKNQRKIRRAASNVVLVCLFLIAGLCLYKLGTIAYKYYAGRSAYTEIADIAESEDSSIDWAKLQAVNPDVIGWLKLEGTIIDYPVVQGTDNQKYLNVLFDGKPGPFGTLFADYRTKKPFGQICTVIYGHHMNDGSMFNILGKYEDQEYAKKHPVFDLYTPDGDCEAEVAAYMKIDATSQLYDPEWSENNPKLWAEAAEKAAAYMVEDGLDPDERYLMLSTCVTHNDPARHVVIARLK